MTHSNQLIISKIKAWAIVSRRYTLLGGGDKKWGYTPLCVFSTRLGAKQHLSKTRNDIVIPCEIVFENCTSSDC